MIVELLLRECETPSLHKMMTIVDSDIKHLNIQLDKTPPHIASAGDNWQVSRFRRAAQERGFESPRTASDGRSTRKRAFISRIFILNSIPFQQVYRENSNV